ncbi:SDR family oxidoreductase [Actinoallomurus purpureus]|uniref:SDR family oxidoreductase n=1 Tax=Actinoallomurus purpureus TaxID=478114 RepID=UPI0020936A9E|nr:SDR family oxidoreductase [Actinoallomurus purpureus]MCO6007510.1 SDR family oxidoreductase [Actinoallomurus purpureus]
MRVVVLGGTSGIGLAIAESCAANGDEVLVTGRDPEKLQAVSEKVAVAEAVDGRSEEDVRDFFARHGRFDHLVLALSGAGGGGALRDLKLDDLRDAFEGKFFPHLLAAQASLDTIAEDGSITFITAVSAQAALPGTAGLAAINGGLERAVPPLAAELAPIRVNAVSPGVIDTPWWSFLPEEQRREQFAAYAEQTPVGRVGRPQDVADAVRYLMGAGFVTGTVLKCEGGLTL